MKPTRYVIVAGSGKTSRANVEALMEDHYFAHKNNQDIVLVLPYKSKPYDSQVWAAQQAEDLGFKVHAIQSEGEPNSSPEGLPMATFEYRPEMLEEYGPFYDNTVELFIVPADSSPLTLYLLNWAEDECIPVYDLSNGLIPFGYVK